MRHCESRSGSTVGGHQPRLRKVQKNRTVLSVSIYSISCMLCDVNASHEVTSKTELQYGESKRERNCDLGSRCKALLASNTVHGSHYIISASSPSTPSLLKICQPVIVGGHHPPVRYQTSWHDHASCGDRKANAANVESADITRLTTLAVSGTLSVA